RHWKTCDRNHCRSCGFSWMRRGQPKSQARQAGAGCGQERAARQPRLPRLFRHFEHRVVPSSAKRERKSLDTRIKELDLKGPILDLALLTDQLIQAISGHGAVAATVHVHAFVV